MIESNDVEKSTIDIQLSLDSRIRLLQTIASLTKKGEEEIFTSIASKLEPSSDEEKSINFHHIKNGIKYNKDKAKKLITVLSITKEEETYLNDKNNELLQQKFKEIENGNLINFN